MADYENLIQIDGVGDPKARAKAAMKRASHTPRRNVKAVPRGCDQCPSKANWKHGVKPIKGHVFGKRVFVWAMCPGPTENARGKELLGRAGKLWWDTLASVGVDRKDCDVQNVVRCYTVDVKDDDYLKMRNPNKQELHCCSIYTDKALEKSKARVHVILGQVAQAQLLGPEFKKKRKIFYSDRFKAWIVCVDHPAFFVRQGGEDAVQHSARFKEWCKLLVQIPRLAKVKGGRFAYLEKQDYRAVVTAKEALEAERIIRKYHRRGERISTDFEEGEFRGRRTALVIGFCPKPGLVFVFFLDHPFLPKPRTRRDYKIVWKVARRLVSSDMSKVLQKGNYDTDATSELMGVPLNGYDYDTLFAEYQADPEAKAYGLLSIVNRRFPRFVGYKEVVMPDALRPDFVAKLPKKLQEGIQNGTADWSVIYEKSRKSRGQNLAQLPAHKMVLYNGGDCDVQKRIELTTKRKVYMPLHRVYRDSGFVLARMERFDAPLFDVRWHKKLLKFFPVRMNLKLQELRAIVRKVVCTKKPAKVVMTKPKKGIWHTLDKNSWKKFNPNSPPQVLDLLYNWLKLPIIETKKNKDRKTGKLKATTDKEVMIVLSEYHPAPKLIYEIRHDKKVCSTYLEGFARCADFNNGHLRTKWNTTGGSTGRISSGGGQKQIDDEDQDVVNLQNIHGDPLLQCLVVSTTGWYRLQEYWEQHGPFKSDSDIPDWVWDMDIFLGFDHAQMELRVLAQKSGDPALIKIFSTKQLPIVKNSRTICGHCFKVLDQCGCGDPHSLVGHELTGWEISVIKNDDRVRRVVKNMQFGIVFGLNEDNLFDYMVAKGVYKYSDGTPKGDREEKKHREEVKEFHRKYFKRFARVKIMIDRDRAFAEQNGFVETLTHLVRPLNVDGEEENARQSSWKNQAVNTPIQGTASHLMLMGLVPLQRKPKRYKRLQHPQLEIHDAIYFRLKLRYMWSSAKRGRYMLEKEPMKILKNEFKINWKVPLMAEPKAGFRFGVLVKDIHKITGKDRTARFLNEWCKKNKLMNGSLKCQMKNKHVPVKVDGKKKCERCGKPLDKS